MKNKEILINLVNKLKKEYNDLNTKINNLDIWLQLYKDDLNKDYIEMMEEQKDIMIDYSELLYQRIKYLIKTYK